MSYDKIKGEKAHLNKGCAVYHASNFFNLSHFSRQPNRNSVEK